MKTPRSRARWSLAMMSWCLLSLSAAFAAEEGSPSPRRLLGPLVLIKPLSPHTLTRLTDEAESLYRFGLHRQSLDAFEAVTELVPGHAQAWLRVGNIQQRLGRRDRAIAAYRKAVANSSSAGDEVRRKALFNLGVIHLDEVDKIITALEALGQPGAAPDAPEAAGAGLPPAGGATALAPAPMLERMRAARDDAADRMQASRPAAAAAVVEGRADAAPMPSP